MDRLVNQHGKLLMLVEFNDFHGWTGSALWEDIKFDAKHFNDIERLAIIGENKWQKGMAAFASRSPRRKSAISITPMLPRRGTGLFNSKAALVVA